MQFLKERKLDISLLMVLCGGAITFFSVMSLMATPSTASLWGQFHTDLQGWLYWLLLLGGAVLVGGGYYLFDHIKMRKELTQLLKITSKSKFIQNQDRIEELAWRLGPLYEDRVIKRKKELRVK